MKVRRSSLCLVPLRLGSRDALAPRLLVPMTTQSQASLAAALALALAATTAAAASLTHSSASLSARRSHRQRRKHRHRRDECPCLRTHRTMRSSRQRTTEVRPLSMRTDELRCNRLTGRRTQRMRSQTPVQQRRTQTNSATFLMATRVASRRSERALRYERDAIRTLNIQTKRSFTYTYNSRNRSYSIGAWMAVPLHFIVYLGGLSGRPHVHEVP